MTADWEIQIQTLVERLTEEYCWTHNFEHARTVANRSRDIYNTLLKETENLGVRSEEVVVSAAWLHDVLDKKMIKSDKEYKEKEREIRSLLAKLFTAEEAHLIMEITENVSYSKEVKGKKKDLGKFEILRNIVSDADKLEAIGMEGLFRCYMYNFGAHGCHDQATKDLVQHCDDKLIRLQPLFIKTPEGKRLGEPLHQAIVDFRDGKFSFEDVKKYIHNKNVASGLIKDSGC
eukprot:sb/3469375/